MCVTVTRGTGKEEASSEQHILFFSGNTISCGAERVTCDALTVCVCDFVSSLFAWDMKMETACAFECEHSHMLTCRTCCSEAEGAGVVFLDSSFWFSDVLQTTLINNRAHFWCWLQFSSSIILYYPLEWARWILDELNFISGSASSITTLIVHILDYTDKSSTVRLTWQIAW